MYSSWCVNELWDCRHNDVSVVDRSCRGIIIQPEVVCGYVGGEGEVRIEV